MKKYILPFRHPEREIRQLLTHLGFVVRYCRFVSNMKYKSDYLIRKYLIITLKYIDYKC